MTGSNDGVRWSSVGWRVTAVIVIALTLVFALAWRQSTPLETIGQPERVGPVQTQFEQPFFEGLNKSKVFRAPIHYVASDGSAADSSRLEQLRMGRAHIVSLRIPESVSIEPSLALLDVTGYSPDFRAARERANAVSAGIDAQLRARWKSRLLGIYPMGPQVLMCRREIGRLTDLKGLRIRVAGEAQAAFVYGLSAIPARLAFLDTEIALNDGLIDCAISGLVSARHAGWLRTVTHVVNFPLQFALNGYVISEPVFDALGEKERGRIRAAFDVHVDAIWEFAQRAHADEIDCHAHGRRCAHARAPKLTVVELGEADRTVIREYSRTVARALGHDVRSSEEGPAAQRR